MKTDLKLTPIHVKNGWYYEEDSGFSVVSPAGVAIIVIPWSKILASVARYKRPAKRKKR